jgi:hypothetical protein
MKALLLFLSLLPIVLGGTPSLSAPPRLPKTQPLTPSKALRPSLPLGETWMGVYLGPTKIGWGVLKVEPQGKGFRLSHEVHLRIALLGQEVEQQIAIVEHTKPDLSPLSLQFKMTSAGHTTAVTAQFLPRKVRCTVVSGDQKSSKEVPIPPGVKLSLDPQIGLGIKPVLNRRYTFHYFNPATLTIDKADLVPLRQEEIVLQGIRYNTLVVKATTPMGETLHWQDLQGNLLRMEALLGLTLVREPKDLAQTLPETKYAPPADLAEISALKTEVNIPDPRKIKKLKVLLSGESLPEIPQDDRQSFRRTAEGNLEVTITASPESPSGSLSLLEVRKRYPEWVKEGPYLPTSSVEVQKIVRQVLGAEKNAFWASQKLRDWVHSNMKVDASIGILRGALDILADRRGVCRDFAVLYTTLARSAGIPTRICAGLVYVNGGFYYHAWAESFVGRWIPVDPTLPSAFVDATHLSLAKGEASAMFSAGRAMGRIKIEVLEYQ